MPPALVVKLAKAVVPPIAPCKFVVPVLLSVRPKAPLIVSAKVILLVAASIVTLVARAIASLKV